MEDEGSGGQSRSPGPDGDHAKALFALAPFSSPRKAKTVRMSEAHDVVVSPTPPRSSRTGSAGPARALGSSSGVPSEGALQDTPDYIRRSTARHRVAPLELFSDSVSPPPPPAPEGLGAASEGMDSIEKCHATGGVSESEAVGGGPTDSDRLHPEEIGEDKSDCCGLLKHQYAVLLREEEECRRLLEDLMRENKLKTRECREAQESLHDLQMELMRKSMHVASLASAVEGQVKEKSRLCQLLKELGKKFMVLKSEQQNLRQESLEYRKCVLDASQMSTTIQKYVNQYVSFECEFKCLKEKFNEEAKERKDLHNKLIELKGIELGQAKKEVDVGELLRYKLMVGRAKQDSKNKDAQIKSMEERMQTLEAKNKAKDLLTVNLQEKMKELESQLLVERKIARQHVDNKIGQDHLQKQHDMKGENSYLRGPMAERNLNSTAEKATAPKDFGISKQMFSDSNTDNYSFCKQLMTLRDEKENNPEAVKLPPRTKARRVSLCNGGACQQPLNPALRRMSLIPLPAARPSLIPLPRRNSLLPMPTAKPAAAAARPSPLVKIMENLSSPLLCSPPVVSIDKCSRSKRINSILRRSLQKKVVIRPSLAALAGKKPGAAAAQGTDNARRVSVARRVPVSVVGGAGQKVTSKQGQGAGWNKGRASGTTSDVAALLKKHARKF